MIQHGHFRGIPNKQNKDHLDSRLIKVPPVQHVYPIHSTEVNMAKVIIHLNDNEFSALIALAQREYRAPKAQASLIIRRELEKLGMVGEAGNEKGKIR